MSIITRKFASEEAFRKFTYTDVVTSGWLVPVGFSGSSGSSMGSSTGATYYLIDTKVDRDAGTLHIHSDEKIHPYFYKNKKQNQVLSFFIVGTSGSGKSVRAGKILDQLIEHDDKPVFIFAINDEDPALDKKRGKPKRMPIRIPWADPDLYAAQIADYKKTYMVFDDIEQMHDKQTTLFCKNLRDLCLTAGRKLDITTVSVAHDLLDKNCRTVLKESKFHILFPKSGRYTTEQYLEKRLNLYKKMRDQIMKLKTFKLIVHSHYPRYLLADNDILLLD